MWRNCDCDLSWGDHVQWSCPDTVDEIYEYIPNLHGNRTSCYFMNDCRIQKQKNPSEGSDVSSSKKWEQQICQQPQPLAQWQVSFFVKRLKSQGNSLLKTLVKCVSKTAEDSVKEASKRKQGQHILLKVQNTELAAWEAHHHATCRRDYTWEDDRRQETIKDTKTIQEQASKKTIYFQDIVQYVTGRIV